MAPIQGQAPSGARGPAHHEVTHASAKSTEASTLPQTCSKSEIVSEKLNKGKVIKYK